MPALRCSLILALTLVVNVNANDAQANEPAAPIPLASSDRIHDAGRLIQAHQAEQALSLLRAEIATQPSPERLGHARHLLGLALLETEQFKEARDVLSLALAERRNSGTHLSDQVRMALGRAEAALENYATAAQIWAPLLRGPSSSLAMQAAIARAEAFKKSGRNTAARRAYTHFLKTWPHAPRYHDAELEIALLDLKRRRTRSAIERLHGLALHHPNTNAGGQALSLLEDLVAKGHRQARRDTPNRRLEQLELWVSNRRFAESQKGLEALREEAQTRRMRSIATRAGHLLVRVYEATWQEDKALAMIEATGATISPARQAKLWARLGKMDKAEGLIAKAHGKRRHKSGPYWKSLGELRKHFGDYEGAYKAFARAKAKMRWDRSLGREMGWCLLMTGKPKAAMPLLRPRGKTKRSSSWTRYWHARALQLSGDETEALSRFESLAADKPLKYYGILAHSRVLELKGQAPSPQPTQLDPNPFPMALFAAFEMPNSKTEQSSVPLPSSSIDWPAEALAPPWNESAQPLDHAEQIRRLESLVEQWGSLAPESYRALEFARLGMLEDARRELRVISRDCRAAKRTSAYRFAARARAVLMDNRREKRALGGASMRDTQRRTRKEAREFRRHASAINEAVRFAQQALGEAYAWRRAAFATGSTGQEPTPENLPRWKHMFPLAFADLVQNFSQQHQVPAYLTYAIMTVESGFYPHPISVAHAYGLLQVIPRTGGRIAKELGFSEFSPERLLEPKNSVYFGTHYLGQLLKKFQGQELLVAAGYNGGPHRVASWLRANPKRPLDVFVEDIPYNQTRKYAKRVLEYVAKYRRIYEGERAPYITNRMREDVLLQPNY